MMKALCFCSPHSLRIEDRAIPIAKPGEVLIKVAAAGLCGTDRHIADGSYNASRSIILGHEIAGTVETIGQGVDRLPLGSAVCIDPNLACHGCKHCHAGQPHLCSNAHAVGVTRDGGLASYVSVPSEACHIVPSGLSLLHAILGEPLSCVLHALDRARVQIGTRTAIWGLGTAGIMMIQCLRATGQKTIIGISHHEKHRHLGLRAGATHVITPFEAAAGIEVDLAIEASGSPEAFEPAFNALAAGGRMLIYGVMSPDAIVPLRPEQLFRRELTLIGSYVGPGTLDRALSLLASRIVDPELLLGESLTLEEAQDWICKVGTARRAKAHVIFDDHSTRTALEENSA